MGAQRPEGKDGWREGSLSRGVGASGASAMWLGRIIIISEWHGDTVLAQRLACVETSVPDLHGEVGWSAVWSGQISRTKLSLGRADTALIRGGSGCGGEQQSASGAVWPSVILSGLEAGGRSPRGQQVAASSAIEEILESGAGWRSGPFRLEYLLGRRVSRGWGFWRFTFDSLRAPAPVVISK